VGEYFTSVCRIPSRIKDLQLSAFSIHLYMISGGGQRPEATSVSTLQMGKVILSNVFSRGIIEA
jgi:hypothetical protein